MFFFSGESGPVKENRHSLPKLITTPFSRLDVRVLVRLTRPDERQMHTSSVRPGIEHLAFELEPVIDGNGSR
jgi:hypothetical protein